MTTPVISVENLSKCYQIGHRSRSESNVNLRDIIGREMRNAARKAVDVMRGRQVIQGDEVEEFWALKDVSFDLHRGEVLGIIGRNGAGKSTLLKILSRITEPTSGRVTLRGRVASLLEVGTGFHPELTGRENVYLNGAILGMRQTEIRKKFDEIVAFAEIDKFLDTPVKRYSSGMYVRLAFAVAAHLEPEILIVDEVLAVGDVAFQNKCMGKMSAVARENRTVLFVSHNMGAIKSLTGKSILLENGSVAASGDSASVVEKYLMSTLETKSGALRAKDLDAFRRWRKDDAPGRILKVSVADTDENDDLLPEIELGSNVAIDIHLAINRAMPAADICIAMTNAQGEPVTSVASSDYVSSLSLQPGERVVRVKIGDLHLAPGRYFVEVALDPIVDGYSCDVVFDYPLLAVVNRGRVIHGLNRSWGSVHCQAVEWSISEPQAGVPAYAAASR